MWNRRALNCEWEKKKKTRDFKKGKIKGFPLTFLIIGIKEVPLQL